MGAPLEIKGRIVEMEQLSMNDVCCHGNSWRKNEMYRCRIHAANIATSIICRLLVDSHSVSWILNHHLYPEIQSASLPVRARPSEIKSLIACTYLAQFQKRRQLRQKKKHKENQLKRRAEKG